MNNRLLLITLLLSFISFGQEQDAFLKDQGYYKKSRWTLRDSSLINKICTESKRIAYTESERAELLARTAVQLSDKIEYYEGKVDAFLALSGSKLYLNQRDSALHYVMLAENLAKRRKFQLLEIRSIELKGSVYAHMEQYDKATDTYFEAIRKGGKISERQTIKSYANLGHVFKKLGNLKRSREYSTQAYDLGKKYKDTSVMLTALNILALTDKSEEKNADALEHFEEGLQLARESNNLERESQILYNMSNVYFNMGDYDKGFDYFYESIAISRINGTYLSTAISFHSLAFTYYELGRVAEANNIADSALHYGMLSENYEMIMEACAMKAEILDQLGRTKEGFHFLEMAYSYKDSMNLAQLNNAAITAESAFEREKRRIQDSLFRVQKQLEIDTNEKINQQRLRSRDLLIWIFAGVLVLTLIGAYFLIKNNRLIKIQNALVNSQKEEIQVQHTEIRDSINYAKRIQDAMILKQSEWEKVSPKHWIFFRPKDVVSGDFYWVHTKEHLSIWAVADCTGHGVPGAFMSMLGYGFLNEIIIEGGCNDPAEILNRLRTKIIHALSEQGEEGARDGMDISICVWNKNSNQLTYAGAHNPLWLIRHKSSELPERVKRITMLEENALQLLEIEPDKMPVGSTGMSHATFSNKSIQLYSGDVIVLLTDGFADQFGGPDGKKLKYAPLKRHLLEMQSHPFEEHATQLETLFESWKGNLEQIDDVCLVGVKVER